MTDTTPAPEVDDGSRVKLDSTQLSVVVLCSACPWWYGFGFDKLDGWKTGTRHQKTFHPGVRQAEQALRKHADQI